MLAIEPVTNEAGRSDAVALFTEYSQFLRTTQSCGSHWSYDKFLIEIDELPNAYADFEGEVLIARLELVAAACIAYRAATEGSCEIKRLYVRPEFRGRGLARQMVTEVLRRIRQRKFRRAILDTDVESMPGALNLYQSFGFTVYAPQQGTIAFLALALPSESGTAAI